MSSWSAAATPNGHNILGTLEAFLARVVCVDRQAFLKFVELSDSVINFDDYVPQTKVVSSLLADHSGWIKEMVTNGGVKIAWERLMARAEYHYSAGVVHCNYVDRRQLLSMETGISMEILDAIWRHIDPMGGLVKMKKIMASHPNPKSRRWYSTSAGLNVFQHRMGDHRRNLGPIEYHEIHQTKSFELLLIMEHIAIRYVKYLVATRQIHRSWNDKTSYDSVTLFQSSKYKNRFVLYFLSAGPEDPQRDQSVGSLRPRSGPGGRVAGQYFYLHTGHAAGVRIDWIGHVCASLIMPNVPCVFCSN